MGPTGSGKTSLLNTLACRVEYNKNMKLDGNIYLNGKLRDQEEFKKDMAYVMQTEELFPFLTVRETFECAAEFYLPYSLSK
jgi:ATP-binding cassette subfamily G (WHITE) protein 2